MQKRARQKTMPWAQILEMRQEPLTARRREMVMPLREPPQAIPMPLQALFLPKVTAR